MRGGAALVSHTPTELWHYTKQQQQQQRHGPNVHRGTGARSSNVRTTGSSVRSCTACQGNFAAAPLQQQKQRLKHRHRLWYHGGSHEHSSASSSSGTTRTSMATGRSSNSSVEMHM